MRMLWNVSLESSAAKTCMRRTGCRDGFKINSVHLSVIIFISLGIVHKSARFHLYATLVATHTNHNVYYISGVPSWRCHKTPIVAVMSLSIERQPNANHNVYYIFVSSMFVAVMSLSTGRQKNIQSQSQPHI